MMKPSFISPTTTDFGGSAADGPSSGRFSRREAPAATAVGIIRWRKLFRLPTAQLGARRFCWEPTEPDASSGSSSLDGVTGEAVPGWNN